MSRFGQDPPLPLGAQAYLAAFDRYLFAQTHTEKVDARHEMREQLDVMIEDSGADVEVASRKEHRRFKSEAELRAAHAAGEISTQSFRERLRHRVYAERRRAA